jgi:hypothetical protein
MDMDGARIDKVLVTATFKGPNHVAQEGGAEEPEL